MKIIKMIPFTVVVLLMCWCGLAKADTPANIGAGSFTNAVLIMDNASVQDMRDEAYHRATHDQFRVRSTTQGEERIIEGTYAVTDGDKIFFFHSDDGSDVLAWELDESGQPVNEQPYELLKRYGLSQNGTKLDQSLHQLPMVFKNGKTYKFYIKYKNTIHNDPRYINGQLIVDSDGVSLFVLLAPTLSPNKVVNLVLSNMSRTVAGQKAIYEMASTEKQIEGAKIRVNCGFHKGGTVEDYLIEDRIVEDDPSLLDARLELRNPSDQPVKGQWALAFPPDKIRIWQKKGANWEKVKNNELSEVVSLPLTISLKVEGIAESKAIQIKATFASARSAQDAAGSPVDDGDVLKDTANLTSSAVTFMITFDDGPYRHAHRPPVNGDGATQQIRDALKDVKVGEDEHRVKAAFFQVGHEHNYPDVKPSLWWILIPPYGLLRGVMLHFLAHDHFKEGIEQANGNNYDLSQSLRAAGHDVCNHTRDHWSPARVRGGLILTNDQISGWERAAGNAGVWDGTINLFRRPYMLKTMRGSVPARYTLVWGFLTDDFAAGMDANTQAKRVIAKLQHWDSENGPLPVVFHDWPDATFQNIAAIIQQIRNQDFLLVDFDKSEFEGNFANRQDWWFYWNIYRPFDNDWLGDN